MQVAVGSLNVLWLLGAMFAAMVVSKGKRMTAFSQATIVVPVDFSERAYSAVGVALDIADVPVQVHVLHVLHEPQSEHPDAIWVTIDHAKRREQALSELHERLNNAGYYNVKETVEFGDPGHRVVELAERLGTGLIVMPSRGRRGISRLLLGSVAERVVRLAHCPVLILRE
jgi:nucleotide-binding universal stress UspA family protein